MATQGGPAKQVSVQTGGRQQGGAAIPIAVVTDGRAVEGGPAVPIYLVTSGPVQGGPALPVVAAAAGARVAGGPAVPAYVVSGSFSLPSILSSGLLAEWRFLEGSGTSVADSSGNGNTLSLVNTPTWGSGFITLVAASSQHGNIAVTPLTATNNYTLEAVIQETSVPGQGMIMASGDTAANGYGMAIGGTTGDNSGVNALMLRGGIAWTDSAADFANNTTWYHVVLTRLSGTMSLYLNGVAGGTTQAGAPNAPSGRLVLGGRSNPTTTTTTLMSGKVAYGVLRTAGLSAAEVAAEYAIMKTIMAARGISLP